VIAAHADRYGLGQMYEILEMPFYALYCPGPPGAFKRP
jgi:hypothetical protein